MASGDDKAASKAGHMAAPTTKCSVQMALANGEPSTHGAAVARPQSRLQTGGYARSASRKRSDGKVPEMVDRAFEAGAVKLPVVSRPRVRHSASFPLRPKPDLSSIL